MATGGQGNDEDAHNCFLPSRHLSTVEDMDRRLLFLRTVQDLAGRVDAGEEYGLLMASLPLRKLLTDDQPLVHQVNRAHRLKIRFAVTAEDRYTRVVMESKPVFYAVQDGLSPRLAVRPRANIEELTLDQFLARRIMMLRGRDVSVLETLNSVAYDLGGIHPGTPKDELAAELARTNQLIAIGGIPAVTRSLRGVAAVVVDSLGPLVDRVEEELAGR